jgi:hypothetical protein
MTQPISKVHLIFKTHLDMGFTDYAHAVVRQYFEEFIPKALATAETLRRQDRPERFVWTLGSWLIYEYLEEAAPAERQRMEAAIAVGDIAWHGLPFTFHSELVDPSLFRAGLNLSLELDQRFGKETIAAKMTDVPGHTRGIVPLLADSGIRFLHIGVNEASTPPDVPPIFRWRDEDNDAEIAVMYQHTYGASATVPGLAEALTFAHTNDNHGPQTPEGVIAAYGHLREEFPRAEVQASTLNDFARTLDTVWETLPVLTGELGDTWIHGAGTDPLKVSRYRALCRQRRQWVQRELAPAEIEALHRFDRTLLCVPEHTWGMDEKTHLADYEHYDRASFDVLNQSEPFQRFAASWAEQRSYINDAVRELAGTSLAEEASAALAQTEPTPPDLTGYTDVTAQTAAFETANFTIDFDRHTGAIVNLLEKQQGRHVAWPASPLGWLRYQTFNAADYERFMDQYLARRPDWSIPDFSKPGLEQANGISAFWQPDCTRLLHKTDHVGAHFLVEFSGPEEAVASYGCPARFTLEVTLPAEEPEIRFTLHWFDKPANRQPEAIWFTFAPQVDDPTGWQLHKMGQFISPLEVVRRGNRRLHAVDGGVVYGRSDSAFTLESLDAVLVAPGAPSLLNFHDEEPSLAQGMHFNLYNNAWGTNFPMWYEDDGRFRFVMRF